MPKSAKELEQEDRNLYEALRREFWESAAVATIHQSGTMIPPEYVANFADGMANEWKKRFPFVLDQEKPRGK